MVVSSMATSAGVRELTRVQIFRHVTRDRLLEISDLLSFDPKRSKIVFTLLEFGEDHRATVRVRHYADAADFKLVCWDLLNGVFSEWTDHKGTAYEDSVQARTLTLRKDPRYRHPFVLQIDNGTGSALPGGAIRMEEVRETLTLLLPEFEMRRLAQTVLDYVRDWETVHFRRRQEAQTVSFTVSDPSSAEPAAEPEPEPVAAAPKRRGRRED